MKATKEKCESTLLKTKYNYFNGRKILNGDIPLIVCDCNCSFFSSESDNCKTCGGVIEERIGGLIT